MVFNPNVFNVKYNATVPFMSQFLKKSKKLSKKKWPVLQIPSINEKEGHLDKTYTKRFFGDSVDNIDSEIDQGELRTEKYDEIKHNIGRRLN